MEPIAKNTIRELYGDLSLDIDPVYIMPAIRRVVSWEFCNELKRIDPRQDRLDKFMDEVLNNMSLDEFFEILQYQDTYTFLVDKIERKLKRNIQENEVYTIIKIKLFTEHRKELVEFRHILKTYSLTGRHIEFQEEVDKVVSLWNNTSYRRGLSVRNRQKLADRYFFVRDAQCENMRLQYDTKKVSKTNVLDEIRDIAPHTTNPTLTTMMYLARKASAMIMPDPSAHYSAYTDYLEIAEQHTELVPACRETGLVHYIKYNFMGLKYEEHPDPENKELMLKVAGKAVDHFCREYEKVSADFKNIFKIKLSHLHLGIGILGNNMRGLKITEEDIENANFQLSLLTENDKVGLSHRWKWGLRFAEAKILWLKCNFEEGINKTNRALYHARLGNFTKEIKGTEEMMELLKARKTIEYLENLEPYKFASKQNVSLMECDKEFKTEPKLSKAMKLVILESALLNISYPKSGKIISDTKSVKLILHAELYKSLSQVVNGNDLKGLQKDKHKWIVYLRTKESRDLLLDRGISFRNRVIQLHRPKPKSLSIRVKSFPLSESDDKIFTFLNSNRVKIRKYYRDRLVIDGVKTDCQTGDRVFTCENRSSKLTIPRHVSIGKYKAQVIYKGQVNVEENVKCLKCFRPGHIQELCTEDWICFSCSDVGHDSSQCPQKCIVNSTDESSDSESD